MNFFNWFSGSGTNVSTSNSNISVDELINKLLGLFSKPMNLEEIVGHSVLIVGPSGSGKTTLAKAILKQALKQTLKQALLQSKNQEKGFFECACKNELLNTIEDYNDIKEKLSNISLKTAADGGILYFDDFPEIEKLYEDPCFRKLLELSNLKKNITIIISTQFIPKKAESMRWKIHFPNYVFVTRNNTFTCSQEVEKIYFPFRSPVCNEKIIFNLLSLGKPYYWFWTKTDESNIYYSTLENMANKKTETTEDPKTEEKCEEKIPKNEEDQEEDKDPGKAEDKDDQSISPSTNES